MRGPDPRNKHTEYGGGERSPQRTPNGAELDLTQPGLTGERARVARAASTRETSSRDYQEWDPELGAFVDRRVVRGGAAGAESARRAADQTHGYLGRTDDRGVDGGERVD